MDEQTVEGLASILREEAENCRKSSVLNGEYNVPFYVASIVLDSLANRLSAATVSHTKEEG